VESNTAEIQTLPEMHHIPNKNFAPIQMQEKRYNIYEGWNFNSGNYLFTTDTK